MDREVNSIKLDEFEFRFIDGSEINLEEVNEHVKTHLNRMCNKPGKGQQGEQIDSVINGSHGKIYNHVDDDSNQTDATDFPFIHVLHDISSTVNSVESGKVESLLKCFVCRKGFRNEDELNGHVKTHSKDTILDARPEDVQSIDSLKFLDGCRTEDRIQLMNLTNICVENQIVGEQLPRVDSRIVIDTDDGMKQKGDVQFNCSLCSIQFNSKSELCEHLKTHLFDDKCVAESIIDEGARDGSNDDSDAIVQADSELEKDLDINLCDEKKKSHSRDIDLKQFIRKSDGVTDKAHSGRMSYDCNRCNKKFKSKVALKKHVAIHLNSNVIKCEICYKVFSLRTRLKSHMWNHTKDNECFKCHRVFTDSLNLNRHLGEAHKDSESKELFKCDVCSRLYKSSLSLKKHLRLHKRERFSKCFYCNKEFKSVKCLQKHEKTHSTKKSFSCEVCSKHFFIQRDLNRHSIRAHSSLKVHKCDRCSKSFGLEYDLRRHQRNHIRKSPLSCVDCGREFISDDDLKSHSCAGKPFKCGFCDETFKDADNMKEHVATHGTLYRCGYCNEGFMDLAEIKDHVVRHQNSADKGNDGIESKLNESVVPADDSYTKDMAECYNGGGDRSYECRVCRKVLKNALKLKRHLWCHKEDKSHKCEECGKTFLFLSNLNFHLRRTHAKQIPHKCIVCGEVFDSSDAMREHKNVHSLQCNFCNETFQEKSELDQHVATHDGEKPFKCKMCNSHFKSRTSLNVHSRVHTGELYRCEHCNKGFTQPSSLKRHTTVHTGEKPYQCEICGKCFREASKVKVHMKSHTGEGLHTCRYCSKQFATENHWRNHEKIHTGDKPLMCDICGKRFIVQSTLNYHMMSCHTGETRHQCSYCGKGFVHLHGFKRHMRTHTGEKPFVCDVCGKYYADKCKMMKHNKICKGKQNEVDTTTNFLFLQLTS